jgi:uncharacterized protein (TIGR03382 family)
MRWKEVPIRNSNFNTEPSRTEVVLILVVTFSAQIVEALRTVGWQARATGDLDNLDNSNYLALADFIRKWTPTTSINYQHFWGYPYFIIAVSSILHMPSLQALVVISLTSSIVTCLLLHQLYGGFVAVAFGMVSSTWILLSVFGGCEPLFTALLFAAFLAARRERWILAVCLGCAATTVRPIGILMPLALLASLLWHRNWKAAARSCAVALAAAVAYMIPVYLLTGDALVQPRLYSSDWQVHEFPFAHPGILTFPALRLLQGFYYLHDRWNSWPAAGLRLTWIVTAVGGAILLWTSRRSIELPLVERIFGCAYMTFLLCYNFDFIALYIPRFILPALPLLLFAVRKWIPRDRRILWPLAVLSIVFNTVVLFGFQAVFGFKLLGIRLTPKRWE